MSYKDHLHMVPSHMHGAVERYVENGIPPGSFLTAILSNDLSGSFARADNINQRAIPAWVDFMYNYLPGNCHGSPQIVAAWIAQNGLKGASE